ncbi:MAG: hypothetical protein QOJ26_1024, partial [Thermoplasmata archaeon]|nr:hypothetical protein [Thermoplasmata archaeon]
ATRNASDAPPAEESADAAKLAGTAANLADVLVSTPGSLDSTADPSAQRITDDPEHVDRLGLSDPDKPDQLDYEMFANLAQAAYSADPNNGFVDYEEARASLGLSARQGFHIRAWPNLDEVRRELELGQRFNSSLRIGYVGDVTTYTEETLHPGPGDVSLGTGPYKIRVCVMIMNDAGEVTDGSGTPDAVLRINEAPAVYNTVPATANLPGATYELPLAPNTAVMVNGVSKNIHCRSFTGLASGGGYFYGQGQVLNNGGTTWQPARYNDGGGATPITNFANIYDYSGQLFTPTISDDDARNTLADGHINLQSAERTVVTLFKIGNSCVPICSNAGSTGGAPLFATAPRCEATTLPTSDYGAASPANKLFKIGWDVTNIGVQPTQFHAKFTITPTGGQPQVVDYANTYLLGTNALQELRAWIPAKTNDYCNVGATVKMELWDAVGVQLTPAGGVTSTLPAIAASPPAAPRTFSSTFPPYTLYLDTMEAWYRTGTMPRFQYGGNSISSATGATIELYNIDSNLVPTSIAHAAESVPLPSGTTYKTYALTGAPLPAGSYVAVLKIYNGGTVTATSLEKVLVADNVPGYEPVDITIPTQAYQYPASDMQKTEVDYFDDLFENFCPFYADGQGNSPLDFPGATQAEKNAAQASYHTTRCQGQVRPTGHVGSVLADSQATLNANLPTLLAVEGGHTKWIDVLVIGSGVDHGSLAAHVVQDAIGPWVAQGGHLIVFGSNSQQVTWLQPLFTGVLTNPAGGPLSTPDLDHPLLRVPYVIDPTSYGNAPPALWSLAGTPAGVFATVAPGPANQPGTSALSVSDPGTFQKGRVILAAYQPANLHPAGPQRDAEAKHLITNLVLIGYQDLFLDYGPPLPDQANVIPGVRSSLIDHPQLGIVPITLVVYVFDT